MLNRMLERLVWRCWCWSLHREAWICVAVVDLGTVADSNFLLERPGQCCWYWPLVREVGMFALFCWWGGLQPAGFHAQLPSLFLLTHRENSALLATNTGPSLPTKREFWSPGLGTLFLLIHVRELCSPGMEQFFLLTMDTVHSGKVHGTFMQSTLFILTE